MSAGSKKPSSHSNAWWWYETSYAPKPTKHPPAVFRSHAVPTLQDDVFDLIGGPEQSRLYRRSLKAICTYVGVNFTGGMCLVNSIKDNFADPVFHFPQKEDTGDKDFDDVNFMLAVEEYHAKPTEFRENTQRLWALVYAQCSPRLVMQLKSLPAYQEAKSSSDGRVLLQIIRDLMHDFDSKSQRCVSVQIALHQYGAYEQTSDQSLLDYYEGLMTLVHTHESNKLTFTVTSSSDVDTASDDATAALQESIHAVGFLLKSDRSRYQGLLNHLSNQMAMGIDEYPKTVLDAFYLLSSWKDSLTLQSRDHVFADAEVSDSGIRNGIVCAQEVDTTPSVRPLHGGHHNRQNQIHRRRRRRARRDVSSK